jgi:hypothetical protein
MGYNAQTKRRARRLETKDCETVIRMTKETIESYREMSTHSAHVYNSFGGITEALNQDDAFKSQVHGFK